MNRQVFIIPGFHGSEAAHWQSWLEQHLPGCDRLHGVDWQHPDLNDWVDQAKRQLAVSKQSVWLVAHSFGCLVAAALAAEIPHRIAGLVFVAPAEPRRFSATGGLRNTRLDDTDHPVPSVADLLPHTLPANLPSVLLASENDPWLSFPNAQAIARRWHCHFVNLGEAGHVNTNSGYGPWPGLLQQLQRLMTADSTDFTTLTASSLRIERGKVVSLFPAANALPEREQTALHFTF